MTRSLYSNPKRVLQILWASAATMLIMAIVHSVSNEQSREWVFAQLPALGASGGGRSNGKTGARHLRLSLKEHMALAERSWAKTVKQRHEMIKADYKSIKYMPLYGIFPTRKP